MANNNVVKKESKGNNLLTKKCAIVEYIYSNESATLKMIKTSPHSMNFSIEQESSRFTGISRLRVTKDEPLYNIIMNNFISFGGAVFFDMCNGTLSLIHDDKHDDEDNKNASFTFTYERGQNSDPSAANEFVTSLFDNTTEIAPYLTSLLL